MALTDRIDLELVKEDFIGTDYGECNKCAIERAFYRVFGLDVMEVISYVEVIGLQQYRHKPYKLRHFIEDKTKAYKANNGELIRTIKLTRIN
jgi:hypothetical protein